MSSVPPNNNYRLSGLERRVEVIEAVQPQVLAARVTDLADEIRGLRRAFYTFAFSVAGGSVMFAFTVFELLNR